MSAILDRNSHQATRSAALRAKLKHPVIDGDGHALEFGPVYFDFLKQVGGPRIVERFMEKLNGGWYGFSPEERLRKRVTRPSAWTIPAKNTLDRATATLPRLFRERMDDFGLDFSIVYSTLALFLMRETDEELRRATCRALNTMIADVFREQSDRMTPAACIPTGTPQEAIEELEHAVKRLGLKAAMVQSNVRRPIPEVAERAPELARFATWMDTLCIDSPYDYDPLWAKCVELKVAVTSHSGTTGHGSRVSTTHYIHNHVGHFAAAGEAFAKALVLGGVTQRFPTLNFAFLEGGVAWAAELYAGLVGHCGKRNRASIDLYDPRHVDRELLADLFVQYGGNMVRGRPDPNDPAFLRLPCSWNDDRDEVIAHELDALGVRSAEDLRALFEKRFYFGCEADDPLVAMGFDTRFLPFGARLKPMFSSDIGHWDVPDMTEVLEEAYELVERGLLDEAEFRDFTFTHPATLHAGMNADFFKGTTVEEEVRQLLKAST